MLSEESRIKRNRAHDKWDKSNTKQIKCKFNLKTDADILEHLASISNRQGYIKRLIREDIARNSKD